MPLLSIIVPTYNRQERLKRVLAGLANQSVNPEDFQVIVVSDGSSDGTNEYLQGATFPFALQPILQKNQGVAAARNAGVAAAEADLLLFIDDDVVPQPELVSEHLAWHERFGPDTVVLGPMLSPPDFAMSPWVDWEQAMLVKQYDAMVQGVYEPTSRQFYTGNTSLRRVHVQNAGGFDASFRRAEDIELAFRLDRFGLRFVFNPKAIGYHYAERSFQSWIAIPYAYGSNDVIFTRDRNQHWLLPTVFREFHRRNGLIRFLTTVCLDRPVVSRLTMASLKTTALICHRFGGQRLSQMACSGLWNLRQYQGVADQLGGRAAFFAGTEKARHDMPAEPQPETATQEPQKELHGS